MSHRPPVRLLFPVAMFALVACSATPGATATGGGPATPAASPADVTAAPATASSSPVATPSPVPTPVATPVATPAATPSPVPTPDLGVQPPIDSAEEAIVAVGLADNRFLGYRPLDPGMIGQSNWVEVKQTADGWDLVFVAGSGDCMAGCINKDFAKFSVRAADATVTARCEWFVGEEPRGTPC